METSEKNHHPSTGQRHQYISRKANRNTLDKLSSETLRAINIRVSIRCLSIFEHVYAIMTSYTNQSYIQPEVQASSL